VVEQQGVGLADLRSSATAKDDITLMQAMAAGDASALSVFYDRHSPLVYATCVRMLGDRTTADELLVDIFQEVWHRASQYDVTRANPVTFLLTLTRSRAIDRRRMMNKRSNLKLAGEDQAAEQADPRRGALDDVIASENALIVQKALAEPEPAQRQAIEAAYYDGLSHSEIAELLNKPLGTVKTYIRQGLIRLRDCLRNDDKPRPEGRL